MAGKDMEVEFCMMENVAMLPLTPTVCKFSTFLTLGMYLLVFGFGSGLQCVILNILKMFFAMSPIVKQTILLGLRAIL